MQKFREVSVGAVLSVGVLFCASNLALASKEKAEDEKKKPNPACEFINALSRASNAKKTAINHKYNSAFVAAPSSSDQDMLDDIRDLQTDLSKRRDDDCHVDCEFISANRALAEKESKALGNTQVDDYNRPIPVYGNKRLWDEAITLADPAHDTLDEHTERTCEIAFSETGDDEGVDVDIKMSIDVFPSRGFATESADPWESDE